jgi:hypothetical protein
VGVDDLNGGLARLMASLGPEVTLDGVPEGLTARSIQKVQRDDETGWRQVTDRRRRLRLNTVLLLGRRTADADVLGELTDGVGLTPGEKTFVLSADRRSWSAVERQFGDRTWSTAVELARRDLVMIRCEVADDFKLGPPTAWQLSRATMMSRRTLQESSEASRAVRETRRLAALEALQTDSERVRRFAPKITGDALEAFAAALETASGSARLPVLMAVADDLLAGVRRSSPRDFSIAHFEDSKERDDVAALLADAGVPDEIAGALGLSRSPRMGVAGRIDARINDRYVALSLLAGPVLIRTDQPGLELVNSARELIIVENLQAAEAVMSTVDHDGGTSLVYTAGQPSPSARRHIAAVGAQAERILLCPDADLGGVRIATAILRELPHSVATRVTLCDAGAWPHRPQAPWPSDGASVSGLTRALDGPAASLASTCLARGYRVEQEQNVIAAVTDWLSAAH